MDTADPASPSPSHSEHQTGLALGICDGSGVCSFEPCFLEQPAAAWAKANAHRLGFIIRYPAGAETITGYAYVALHLRFVGRGRGGRHPRKRHHR
jgi:D-alanyl-D-alanine carboxypeptidase